MHGPTESVRGTPAESERARLGKHVNPFVGPRPLRRTEQFYGRERETASVVNSLLSGRIMLLHSPSGAGKTSLIQTSIVPAFEKRGFLVCATTTPTFTALRVNLPPPTDTVVANRYVFSAVNGLVGSFVDREATVAMTLTEAVRRFGEYHAPHRCHLLVFDQLEEVLTADPGDVEGQTEFFRQLGEVLDDDGRWALLAIREDYMGALDRFRRYLPGQLRSSFRLDLLDVPAAMRAVQGPARARGVEVDDVAAHTLVDELRMVHSGHAGEDVAAVPHPYVEPVLLQVVCYGLYGKLEKRQRAGFSAITTTDVEDFRPFGKSIANYYATVVHDVAGGEPGRERALRDWIGQDLISKQGLRRHTRSKPPVGDPDAVLAELQSRYLIRDDPRPGGPPLQELSHDQLVQPILDDNRAWRRTHLARWQNQAEEWAASGRDPQHLLHTSELREARAHRLRYAATTETERAFLHASAEEIGRVGQVDRLRLQRGLIIGLLVLSLLANLVLLLML